MTFKIITQRYVWSHRTLHCSVEFVADMPQSARNLIQNYCLEHGLKADDGELYTVHSFGNGVEEWHLVESQQSDGG